MELSLVAQQLDALLENETNVIANLANAAALLNSTLVDINWVGFYLYTEKTDSLILGPFQGNVACMHIANGSGVCGTALKTQNIQRIANVHEFAGHIACDSASNSELVVPLTLSSGRKLGVLDIDSPILNRFKASDEALIKEFVQVLLQHLPSTINLP